MQQYTIYLTEEQSTNLESRGMLCNPEVTGQMLLQDWFNNTPDTVFSGGGPGEEFRLTSS